MSVEINQLPHRVLGQLGTNRAVLLTTETLGDEALLSTTLQPEDLSPTPHADALVQYRRDKGVYSITMTLLKLDDELIGQATEDLSEKTRIGTELRDLLQRHQDVYVAYAVTHYNPGQKPFGPLMVNIGGDCYRTGRHINSLWSILERTCDLADAMLSKSVMIFPDIPALHGGKKGEWIILDRDGGKIDDISEEAIIALGSVIIPHGIGFLNRYKELRARELGICDHFPEANYVLPDSGSPDVLSGVYWRGEKSDKSINLCATWDERGVDLGQFTCLPANLGGTLDPSSRPTGYGVSTSTVELAKSYFEPRGRDLKSLKFLLEAAGGVGQNTIESLVRLYDIPPDNITVFDRAEGAVQRARERFGVHGLTLRHHEFYEQHLPAQVEKGVTYDVWINNGEGDNTSPEFIDNLLAAGVKVFAGGANNLLQVSSEDESLRRIFDAGAWIWPDTATSGGGWTLAVLGITARCQNIEANGPEVQKRILEIIDSRNQQLVRDVLDGQLDLSGEELWNRVDQLITERRRTTLSRDLSPSEIFEGADSRNWNLV